MWPKLEKKPPEHAANLEDREIMRSFEQQGFRLGLGFRDFWDFVWVFGFRDLGLEFSVLGSGFRV